MSAPFASTEEFIRAASAWAVHLLKREILRGVALGLVAPPGDAAASGPTQLDRAVASLDAEAAGRAHAADDRVAAAGAEAARAAKLLGDRLAATRDAGAPFPYLRLCGEYGLDSQASTLLLLAICVATEPRVRLLLGILQGEGDRGWLSVGVALRLLTPDAHGGNLSWELVAPEGPLRTFDLLEVVGGAPSAALMSRFLTVPDVVAAYATRGELWIDERIAPYARVALPARGWDELAWPAEDKRALRRRLELCVARAAGEPVAVLLRGTVGSGRKAAALAVCRELRRTLLVVDAERLPSAEDTTLDAFRTVIRDARLNGALIYIENADVLRREPGVQSARLRAIASLMPLAGGVLFLGTERPERIDVEDALAPTTLEVPPLTSTERRTLWRKVLPAALDPDGAHVERLVAGFPVNPGDIARVRGEIAALAAAGGGILDGGELVRVVLEQSRHNLRAIASEVATPFDLDDIVVSDEVRAQCVQLVALVERWSALRDEWGLGRRALTNRGISALFSGPPGTGKTMMAAILGRRLGLDVFRIDVAQIMSKWVGETEKNLSRLFGEAARTRAVLVFDEADALFSKRVDVRGSVDRYSNAQVNYLLQKMESFEGIMILTTNLERAVDEAFLRRIQFRVPFREPAAAEREQIWRRMLPPEVALEDVDLRAIAQEFPMTGGAIRNAAVRACLIAMTRGDGRRVLTQAELSRAIVDELGRDPRKKDDPRGGARSTILY